MRRMSGILFGLGTLALPFVLGWYHSVSTRVPYRFGSQNSLIAYLSFGLLLLFVAHVAGVPDETDDVQPAFMRSVFSALVATGLWVLVQTALPGLLPRRVIFQAIAAMTTWAFFCSLIGLKAERRERERESVIAILYEGEEAEFRQEVDRSFPLPEMAFSVSNTILLDDSTVTTPRSSVVEQLSDFHGGLIVVSDAASRSRAVIDVITSKHRLGAKVRTLSMFYDEYLGKVSLSELTKMAMLFDVRNLHHPTYRRIKRAIDFAGGMLAGVLCVVVAGAIFVLNFFSNPGPLLFRQQRVGIRGEEFTIVKFRSMVPVPPEEVGTWTSPDDPRVTPLGKILRRTHLDELPQFWNILRGDLSLVGPRPEQPRYVDELMTKEPAYELRHLIVPGLTGWAQVKLRYADTESAGIDKLQYDLYYLQHQSLTLDLRILSRTVRSVLRTRGR